MIIVECLRTKKNKEWDVLHPLICKTHLTREFGLPRRRWGSCLESNECPSRRNNILGEDQHVGRKLPERVYLPSSH